MFREVIVVYLEANRGGGAPFLHVSMTEVRVQIVSMEIFWFEARVSHIPRAKSVLAMVAKAGAVQRGAHS